MESYLSAVHLFFLHLYNQKKSISLLFPAPSAQGIEASVVPLLKGQSFLFILCGLNLTNNSRELSRNTKLGGENPETVDYSRHEAMIVCFKLKSSACKDNHT